MWQKCCPVKDRSLDFIMILYGCLSPDALFAFDVTGKQKWKILEYHSCRDFIIGYSLTNLKEISAKASMTAPKASMYPMSTRPY